MALVSCRECGKQVADTATTCPACGIAYPGSKVAAAGQKMQACGCAMTLLITLPLLLALAFC
jgi:hypothetical protein